MTKPLLKRLPSTSRFDKTYQVHGFEHLVVEAEFADGDERKTPVPMYWLIRDTRFSSGLDKWNRWQVLVIPTLDVARSWLRAGGASLWDPEKRKIDRDWKPLPDGWSIEEARSEVQSRSPAGNSDGSRLGNERRRDREVRREDSGADRRRDHDPGEPADRGKLKKKRFAVCPGRVTSIIDGQSHYIGFGVLTLLYGVDPAECICVTPTREKGFKADAYSHLIWLRPKLHPMQYVEMREELAHLDGSLKLVEP